MKSIVWLLSFEDGWSWRSSGCCCIFVFSKLVLFFAVVPAIFLRRVSRPIILMVGVLVVYCCWLYCSFIRDPDDVMLGLL